MITADSLTADQRRIVEWGDGPVVVIAGAGTGKTRVIAERVKWLLETKGAAANPTDPLLLEHLLVLTYNVKAAKELQDRLDAAVGTAARARMTVSNFHSFCQRVLTENAADAGLPPRPDVLDGVAQVLLLKDIVPDLPLIYHTRSNWALGGFVQFINRAKDELVSPDDFDAFVAEERRVFEERNGSYEVAAVRLMANGNLKPFRDVRGAYAAVRANERAEARGETPTYDPDAADKIADREARRTVAATGTAERPGYFAPEDQLRIAALAATYVQDGAALEVMRLQEMAIVYRAYELELDRRGALDFGEQIAAVTKLFKTRPNVLRRWQRLYRYLLIDEFQDANIAQIELIELLGRTPDRPDNVMVVGDDDQSIYRFRGASFAAFAEFETRFAKPPTHDPTANPPGTPPRLRIEQNFRSHGHVLTGANRLIDKNKSRFEPDKRLRTDKSDGDPIQLITCAGPEDEAIAIVDRIKELAGEGSAADGLGRPWTDVAVLYRKHKHREAIVARLRDEDIPYTVVGGLSLFETPEIRDLEQALRAITDPHDDVALVRMMTAGPWRLDALEILQVSRNAKFDSAHLFETIKTIVSTGQLEVDTVPDRHEDASRAEVSAPALTRAKLRQLLAALDELNPLTFREGPHTILERYLERTGSVLDLIAADTLEAKRTVTNIASFLRFAADWQSANPNGTLAGFVAYLDAYQQAGGELPTSVELSEDVDGVRLMTLYQAKGLEFPIVFVPNLLDREWPVEQQGDGLFPRDLLREAVPPGDIHTDEERRLLYVAMTRAQDRLILTTHGGAAAKRTASRFVGEITYGAGPEIERIDRTDRSDRFTWGPDDIEWLGLDPWHPSYRREDGSDMLVQDVDGLMRHLMQNGGDEDLQGALETFMQSPMADHMPLTIRAELNALGTGYWPAPTEPPSSELEPLPALPTGVQDAAPPRDPNRRPPTARERRLAIRVRASELVGLMEATAASDPESESAREELTAELEALARSAAMSADEARAQGLDPLTFRSVALDTGAGANLLQVAPLPPRQSFSSLNVYDKCPLQYAFKYVYRMPPRDEPVAAFEFGTTAHGAFEAFTKERRERAARGEPPPTREDLEREFRARWTPQKFGDKTTEDGYQRRVTTLLDNFWTGEVSSLSEALHEELDFELTLDADDGGAPVVLYGQIDRIDRLPSGGIEVIDYKTGKAWGQKGVDESLQLSIYALACRDALGLGTPERVTLYFTESALRLSTTRSDEQLDRARDEILARVARMRSGEFPATPSNDTCKWCDYRAVCPERV